MHLGGHARALVLQVQQKLWELLSVRGRNIKNRPEYVTLLHVIPETTPMASSDWCQAPRAKAWTAEQHEELVPCLGSLALVTPSQKISSRASQPESSEIAIFHGLQVDDQAGY